ncbi:hypothetical protein [Marivirga sp.]|uniref:hypothetical protein n=1 Tax=Marivirga sp. TaxID=2018662 RepID=UPI002D8030C1|nr:hypothetical protein [Marivirga sp.]HET8860593.1 hypothetical protein [Marivirga sp.]
MRGFFILLLFSICVIFSSQAQRLKYKNIFPILQSRDYKTAEPLLINYLKDNDDEANAYFYYGEIIVSKLDSVEIFPTTEKYDSMANIAIAAYKKSISLIDDREVRKNGDYYAAYNRRDLRTGKFGIKKSDITLDYENKIAAVTDEKLLIEEIHKLKNQSEEKYQEFASLISNLQMRFPTESNFILQAITSDFEDVNRIVKKYTDFVDSFRLFVDQLNELNHPAYDASLNIVEIENWNGLNIPTREFLEFNISIGDYEKYFKGIDKKIEEEVRPIKNLLIETNKSFSDALLNNQKAKDSSDIQPLEIPQELIDGLAKLEANQSVLDLLKYKRLKNEANLLSSENLFPLLADSSNVYQRANLIDDYKEKLSEQLDVIIKVEAEITKAVISNFQEFFEMFSPSIEAYIETENTILTKKVEAMTEKSKQMATQIQFFEFEADSIFRSPLIAATNNSSNYAINILESDSSLFLHGKISDNPFVAKAGFDMQIQHFLSLKDSTFSIQKMIQLKENLLVNLQSINPVPETGKYQQVLYYLSPQIEEIWQLSYEGSRTLEDAKVEAGIFFIYDKNGEVMKTLNSKGQEIGN